MYLKCQWSTPAVKLSKSSRSTVSLPGEFCHTLSTTDINIIPKSKAITSCSFIKSSYLNVTILLWKCNCYISEVIIFHIALKVMCHKASLRPKNDTILRIFLTNIIFHMISCATKPSSNLKYKSNTKYYRANESRGWRMYCRGPGMWVANNWTLGL